VFGEDLELQLGAAWLDLDVSPVRRGRAGGDGRSGRPDGTGCFVGSFDELIHQLGVWHCGSRRPCLAAVRPSALRMWDVPVTAPPSRSTGSSAAAV
jgi:hypothetical protein